jgi:hypothetical protein
VRAAAFFGHVHVDPLAHIQRHLLSWDPQHARAIPDEPHMPVHTHLSGRAHILTPGWNHYGLPVDAAPACATPHEASKPPAAAANAATAARRSLVTLTSLGACLETPGCGTADSPARERVMQVTLSAALHH